MVVIAIMDVSMIMIMVVVRIVVGVVNLRVHLMIGWIALIHIPVGVST